jgi:hypothetical protein
MNNNNNSIFREDDVEISLKDLLAFCFLHWRSALIACLLAGALLGGYKGLSVYKTSTPNTISTDKAIPSSTEQVLSGYEAKISSAEEYLKDSEFMHIDPANESNSEVTMLLSSETADYASLDALKKAYISHLQKGSYLKKAAKKYKLDSKYIGELISVKDIDSTANCTLNSEEVSGNINQFITRFSTAPSNSLLITVITSSSKTSEGILDCIIAEANEFNKTLSQEYGSHEITFVSKNQAIIFDKETSTAQSQTLKNVLEAKANYKDYASKFQDELSQTAVPTTDANATHKLAVKTGIKWFCLGAFGIFLAYGFILCIVYITSSKPITREQFYSRYSFFNLGSFTDGRKKLYKNNSTFDKWLRKVMGLNTILDLDEVYDLITANLNVYQKDKKSFVLVGAVNDNMKFEIAEELSQKMDNVKFSVCQDLLNDPTARLSLSEADAIIFVEKYGSSNYEEIDREIALAIKSGKEIAGCINY